MSRSQRAGYAVLCAVAADFVVAAVAEWISPPAGSHWYAFLGFGLLMFVGVIPGALLLAVLTLVTGAQKGFDGVLFFFVGSMIGPVLMNITHPSFTLLNPWILLTSADPLTRLATAISALSTVLYLVVIELLERKRIQAN